MAQERPHCEFDANKLILHLDLTMDCRSEAIPEFVGHIMPVVRQLGCTAGKEMQVELALHEALANAVIHGCHNDPAKKVQCCVACDETRGMLIVIRDPGTGFDPASIPSPIEGQNLYSSHGRGIFLINQMMDEVHYERGGTEIHMIKR